MIHARITRRRSAQMQGDPTESDRLRQPFLAWVGKRSNRVALIAAGIDPRHGAAWVQGRTVLRQSYQAKVRKLLDREGVLRSPAS
jgi:hypothetical protein